MELHSSAKAKQLWNLLKVAIFMMRKGLLSKRKLVGMEVNLMMKRGMLLGKNLGSIVSLHHLHHHHSKSKQQAPVSPISPGFQEYEFSCENIPNPITFHLNPKRRRSYFPCISLDSSAASAADEEPDQIHESPLVLPRCNYSTGNLASGERRRVLQSPFSVRVSNCSMEEGVHGGLSEEVDSRAEEFIKRFYEQLQAQSPGEPLTMTKRRSP